MCGLLGFSIDSKNPSYREHLEMLTSSLLLKSTVRGDQAVGIGYLSQENNQEVLKTLKSLDKTFKFIDTEDYHNVFNNEVNALIGHTRYATMGEAIVANAHPFLFSRTKEKPATVVGAHNGWLIDKDRCAKVDEPHSFQEFCEKHKYPTPQVDSQLIYHHIFETQDPTAMKDIEGAMALCFFFGHTLYLYRRNSKPLYIYNRPESKTPIIIFSSLESAIKDAVPKHLHNYITSLTEDVLYGVINGKIVSSEAISNPTLTIKLDETPSQFYPYSYANNNVAKQWAQDVTFRTRLFEDGVDYEEVSNRAIGFKQQGVNHLSTLLKEFNLTKEKVKLNPYNTDLMKTCSYNVLNHPMFDSTLLKELGYKNIPLPKKALKSVIKKTLGNSNDMYLILSLHTDHPDLKTYRFDKWKVSMEGFNDFSLQFSNAKSRIGFKIPKEAFVNNKVKFNIFPSDQLVKTNQHYSLVSLTYYSLEVELMAGQVSEVTCNIPFFQDFRKDETGSCSINGEVFDCKSVKNKFSTVSVLPYEFDISKIKSTYVDNDRGDSSSKQKNTGNTNNSGVATDNLDVNRLLDRINKHAEACLDESTLNALDYSHHFYLTLTYIAELISKTMPHLQKDEATELEVDLRNLVQESNVPIDAVSLFGDQKVRYMYSTTDNRSHSRINPNIRNHFLESFKDKDQLEIEQEFLLELHEICTKMLESISLNY